ADESLQGNTEGGGCPQLSSVGQESLGALAVDDQSRGLRHQLHQGEIANRRLARFAMVHCERAEHLAARADDRRRPAGPQARAAREISKILPQRITVDVRHEYRLASVSGSPAR